MSEKIPENEIEKKRIRNAIAALEEKRSDLGDDIVEMALAPLKEKLDELERSASRVGRKLRKYVTVLFADISDFTEICGSNDAEYVTEALNVLWTELDSIIIRHGGVIDKHIGDAVMALWGTETVRENDTERAVMAALDMQVASEKILPDLERGIPKFRMRIGVHSGPVFLSGIGLSGEYTAMGDTVNIASRLQSAAPLGTVIVSYDAYRHVRNDFTFREEEPIKVKGIADPLKIYIAESVNSRKFLNLNTGILGIETAMIGREKELDILELELRSAMSNGSPRMVTIIGDAGIGKSRLLHEFRSLAERESGEIVFFNARCTPEMKNIPCSVFRDILRLRMNVKDSDPTEVAWGKFETSMGNYLTRDEVHIACHYAGFDFSASPPVKKLLGNPVLAAAGQANLLDYFRGTAEDHKTLLYLEDLHWADSTSLEMINHLIRNIVSGKLLIVALSRPPLLETNPDWGRDLPHRFINLEPLSIADCTGLVNEILKKVDDLPEDIIELIISSAEGNPFYVEELIAMLVEDGVIEPGKDRWSVNPGALIRRNVPSTLKGVLQARLDSLPESEKELLQKASVIGRLFWDLTVEDLYRQKAVVDIDSMLKFLQSRDLVHSNDDSTFSFAREYLFKHAILRDVTYDTVLLELRKSYHRHVAAWLVTYSGERVSELSGLIAEHFDRGGDCDNAIYWLSRSGRSAFSTSSYSEALSSFTRAMEILPENFDRRERALLHLDTGRAFEKLASYDEAAEHLEKTLEIAEETDDPALMASSLLGLTWIATLRGNLELSREHGKRAYNEALKSGDRSILAEATMRMADFEEDRTYTSIQSYNEKSLSIYREINDLGGIAITLLNMGNTAMAFEQPDDAGRFYRESLVTYESLGNLWGIANCLGNLGNVFLAEKDFTKSREYHVRSLAISTKIGDEEGVIICNLNLGIDASKLEDQAGSFKHYLLALNKAASLGLLPLALSALNAIAEILSERKRLDIAALTLLFMKENESSFFFDGETIDFNELLHAVLEKLPENEVEDTRTLAGTISLTELAEKLGTEAF
jgi:class 3 adenylate cyclase/tetratricopeptide (TPR) repeat protein